MPRIVAALCVVAVVLGLGGATGPAWTLDESRYDSFGISHLRPTRPGGLQWGSRWDVDRRFSGVDPRDPWFDAAHGDGSFETRGGQLLISGPTPRMYVHDPRLRRQWRDVEVTMYVKRIDDTGIAYAGFTAVARANHLTTEDGSADSCDTRGYGARVRFDGHVDFEKETAHPDNQAIANRLVFAGGLPVGSWIGVKYVVFDRSDGVHLQLWLDRTDGRGGGDWRLVDSITDDGHLFGDVPCARGIDASMPLRGAPSRRGSESGRPNVSVYFRGDGIGQRGMAYKWGSVREIEP